METLDNQEEIDKLLARFSDFYDAVLVKLVLDLPRHSSGRRAELSLVAQEAEGEWALVTLLLNKLSEFKLSEGRVSNLVLSDGMRILLEHQTTFIDLAPYSEGGSGVNSIQRSHQYLIGGECRYRVSQPA